jgi:hypothetical protein
MMLEHNQGARRNGSARERTGREAGEIEERDAACNLLAHRLWDKEANKLRDASLGHPLIQPKGWAAIGVRRKQAPLPLEMKIRREQRGDAIETEGEHTARFWLRVVGDEGQSLLREHMAAFAERIWFMKMLLIAPTLELWRRRQTRGLALAIQLCLIAAVLLVWTPLLVARVLLVTSQLGLGLVQSNSGSVSYYLSAAVERPTNQFVSAFMQASANIEASDLHTYHFSSSRVEISTLALARAAVGAAAPTPAFLLDGEEASRLTTDLRVVEGRLPAPAVGVLEVVVTKASADQLHLALGAALPITALAGEPPLVRVVGIVQTVGTVFPTNRAAFDPANQDSVWNHAQSHPLDYVLTSDEAIGTYAYNWAQIASVQLFYSQSSGNTPLPSSENPLWQAWWVGTTEYARMDAQDLTAFLSHAVPDPTMRLNQLLGVPALAKPTGFVSADTSAGFYQGNADYTDQVSHTLLSVWLFAAIVAGLLVGVLGPVTGQLVLRQQELLAAWRDRGASRRRVVGALAMQALALAGLALLAGGLLALLVARSVVAALLPGPARPVVDTLVGGLFDAGLGVAGGIAAALTVLVAVLVMLRATSHNTEALG